MEGDLGTPKNLHKNVSIKLPGGKELDLKNVVRLKTKPNLESSLKTSEEIQEPIDPASNEALDILISATNTFSKLGKASKMIKKNQTYDTNLYLTNRLKKDSYEKIKIESDNIAASEETLLACKNISAAIKLRYKYLFGHHQDCNLNKLFLIIKIDRCSCGILN